MKIGIDARFLTHPQSGGFKTYTENLITALAQVDHKNSYILYLDRTPDQKTRLPKQPNFEYRVVPGQTPAFGMPWREQVRLPRWAKKDRLDLLHSPCLTAPLRLSCASVITIHDMIWYYSANKSMKAPFPLKRKLMNWYYYIIPQLAARNASLILTVSHVSKNRITQTLGISKEKVFVTHEAADPIFQLIDDAEQISAVREKYSLRSNYIMALGSADPRKNITTLIQAYAQLPESLKADYQLVIIWTNSFIAEQLMRQVSDLDLEEHVRFITQVSNGDLVLLYNGASLFVFPSLDEGFGLPPLEAMACGTPVVAADNSSIPEIVGDAALLVNAKDALSMARGINKVLTNENFKADLVCNGTQRVANFSWENCAEQTLIAFEQV